MTTSQKLMPAQQKDFFGNDTTQGQKYDLFRPKYPKEHLELALKYVPGHQNYLDIACGTGQLLFNFYSHFQQAVATDLSEKQLGVVQQKIQQLNCEDRIKFFRSDGHSLDQALQQRNFPIQYDLVTIGEALHWFDVPAFLKLVGQKILKKNGCLGVFGYAAETIELNFDKEIQISEKIKDKSHEIFQEWNETVFMPFCDLAQLPAGYSGYSFEEKFADVVKKQEYVYSEYSVDDIVKYFKTFGCQNEYVAQNRDKEGFVDPLDIMEQKYNQLLQEIYDEYKIQKIKKPLKIKNYFFVRCLKNYQL